MERLNILNDSLSEIELIKSKVSSNRNVCFIVGLPRSGSTLLQQILISRYKVGYASNILGKFWSNPVAGAILHTSLYDEEFKSNFKSEYGNTKGPLEPCEFGWFWKRVLDIHSEYEIIGSNVNWKYINKTLNEMSFIFKQPLIFDTPLVCNHIAKIAKNIERVKVIYLTRNPKSVCNSILSARLKRFGVINKYYGAKPKSWEKIKRIDNPIYQVLQQVYDLRYEIEANLKLLLPENVLEFDISLLREKPTKVTDLVANFLNIEGEPRKIDYPLFFNRDNTQLFDKKYENQFNDAWNIIFSENEK